MADGSKVKITVSWAHGYVAGVTIEASALSLEQVTELRKALLGTAQVAAALNRMRQK